MFLQTSQHTVNNICAEMCMYLVQVDLCPYRNPYSNDLNLHVTHWDFFPKALSMAAYGIQGLRKGICAVLPVLTYLVLFGFFCCCCFSVHHSSVISRRHIESSPGNLSLIEHFQNSSWPNCSLKKNGERKKKPSNDKNLKRVVFKE